MAEDNYNYGGTVGSQPNYPSSYNEGGLIGNQNVYRKENGKGQTVNSYNSGRIGDQNPYPGYPPGGYGRAPGSLAAQGPGSQPMALHTEFIDDGGIDDRSYGTQDTVFYLLRCGEGGGDGPNSFSAPPDPMGGAGSFSVPIDPGGYSGPNLSRSKTQSGANQIALGRTAGQLGEVTGGPMAPMSGFSYEEEEKLGVYSQNAAFDVSVTEAMQNALRTVPGLSSEVVVRGLASSERMFNRMLMNGFNQANDLQQGNRTPEQILDTLNRPTTAELAFQLAQETGGLTRVKDIVQSVNKGTCGAVTPKSRAYQERMSTSGRVGKV